MKKGFIQIYTGDGKGKTTAALGLALRAVGSGLSVLIVQFLKGREQGEIRAAEMMDKLRIVQSGAEEFVNETNPSAEDVELARRGVAIARKALMSNEYDLVILDEVNIAVQLGIIGIQDVLTLIDCKPSPVELVLTGRGAPPEFIEKADLVTEMRNIKHYHDRGIESREGIEY